MDRRWYRRFCAVGQQLAAGCHSRTGGWLAGIFDPGRGVFHHDLSDAGRAIFGHRRDGRNRARGADIVDAGHNGAAYHILFFGLYRNAA